MGLLLPDRYFQTENPSLDAPSGVGFLLITRLKLYIAAYCRDLSGDELRERALSRLALMERFCIPSVLAQRSGVPFRWLVLADSDDLLALRRLREALAPARQALVHAVDRDMGINPAIQAAALEACDSMPERTVATFRLDCDDAIHRDFLGTAELYLRSVPGDAAERPQFFVSYPFGVQVSAAGVRAMSYPTNPFVGFVEPVRDQLATAYCSNHNRIYEAAPVLTMHTRAPMWAQVVHGANARNAVWKTALGVTPDAGEMLRMFGSEMRLDETAVAAPAGGVLAEARHIRRSAAGHEVAPLSPDGTPAGPWRPVGEDVGARTSLDFPRQGSSGGETESDALATRAARKLAKRAARAAGKA